MDKQKQIEEMERDVANAGKIAGDWLMEEAKKLLQENGRFKSTEHTRTLSEIVAEELAKMGYRKIPEDAVVLTKEELAQIQSNFFDAGIKHGSKETAEKFAEMAKERLEKYRLENEWFDEDCAKSDWLLDSSIFHCEVIGEDSLIDEICKELIGGKNNATSRNIKTEE